MKISHLVPLAFALGLAACGGGGGAVPAGSGAPAAGGSAAPAKGAAKEAPKPSAAASFPAKELPAPFATLTIGAPPSAEIKTGPLGDDVTIDGPDYMVKVEEAKDADTSKLKGLLEKMGGKIHVDTADGLIAEVKEKDAPAFQILRVVKVGDKTYKCSNTMKKTIGTMDKAQEAYDVCGSLKAK